MLNLANLGKMAEGFGNNVGNKFEQFPKALNDIKENISEKNSDAPVSKDDIKEKKDIHENIITRNESLEGDVHPITGVPFERRVIHTTLQNNPKVKTESVGVEPYRKVVVSLK